MSDQVSCMVNENFSSQLKKPQESVDSQSKVVKTLGEKSSSSIKLGEKSSSNSKLGSTNHSKTASKDDSHAINPLTTLDLCEIPGVVHVEEEDGAATPPHQHAATQGLSRLKGSETPESKNGSQSFLVDPSVVPRSPNRKSPRNKSAIMVSLADGSVDSIASEIWQAKKPKSPRGNSTVSLVTLDALSEKNVSDGQHNSLTSSGSKKEAMTLSSSKRDGIMSSGSKKNEMESGGSRKGAMASSGSKRDVVVTYTINESFSLNPHQKHKEEPRIRESMGNVQKMLKVMSHKGLKGGVSSLNVCESDFASARKKASQGDAIPATKAVESPRQSRRIASPRGVGDKSLLDDELETKMSLKKDDYLDFVVKKDKGTLSKIMEFFTKKPEQR